MTQPLSTLDCLQKASAMSCIRFHFPLTGERFSAAEAKDYGLLHRVVAADELEAAVGADVAAIARGGPIAVAEAKQLVRIVGRLSVKDGFAYAAAKIATLFAFDEASEGMAAFAEKRTAAWIPSEPDRE